MELEGGKSKIKALANPVSGEDLLPRLLAVTSPGSPVAQLVKNPPAVPKTWVQSLGWEDPLEKKTATHSRILAWRTPSTVQSVGLQ